MAHRSSPFVAATEVTHRSQPTRDIGSLALIRTHRTTRAGRHDALREVLMGGKGGTGESGGGMFMGIPNIPDIELPDIPGAMAPPPALTVPGKGIQPITNTRPGYKGFEQTPWFLSLTGRQAPITTPGTAPTARPTLLPGRR
jgi:hypothetical protein